MTHISVLFIYHITNISVHLCSLQLHSSASRPVMFIADNA